jgi:hypothetical protein
MARSFSTLDEMAHSIVAAETGLSQDAIVRIWHAFGLQSHRVENFKFSKDPQFVERCGTSWACTGTRGGRPTSRRGGGGPHRRGGFRRGGLRRWLRYWRARRAGASHRVFAPFGWRAWSTRMRRMSWAATAKVRAVLPIDIGVADKLQPGFIREGGGLEGVAGALGAHVSVRRCGATPGRRLPSAGIRLPCGRRAVRPACG